MTFVQIPPLTSETLTELGKELGGCDFTDPDQGDFLACEKSCDVQAAPGNGKTTLLVAKLVLLSRTWTSRQKGVCVISHTNVAREQVEKKLSSHSAAAVFLGYPHFIGTVTAFIHQYFALPYLRGLGWEVTWIDDDVFAAKALSIARNDHRLQRWLCITMAKNRNEEIIRTLTFESHSLRVRQASYMPKPGTPTRQGLEELKEQTTMQGVYRFADMTALAFKAIEDCPHLADRVRKRFPLVLLDEAQDTDKDQLKLLDDVFGEGVAFQRLGDQNQTLYEGTESSGGAAWAPTEHIIPLDETRRFGPEIAAFASRLAVRKAQQIKGKEGERSRRLLILFDRVSIKDVLPAYAREVHTHWGQGAGPNLEVWAVASRHSTYSDKKKGAWPRSLVDYHQLYRPEAGKRDTSGSLCSAMRRAATAFKACKPTREVASIAVSSLVDYLELHAFQVPKGRRITCGNLWRCLAELDSNLPLQIRRAIRDQVLNGQAPWTKDAWNQFCDDLKSSLGTTVMAANNGGRISAFLEYDEQGGLGNVGSGSVSPEKTFDHQGVTVRLGSVHSIKGRTVDAILVLESQIYKGSISRMDLEVVLPHAFGVCKHDFQKSPVELAAATNVFVAITRPRQFLALAVHKEAVSNELIEAAEKQGWGIHDLTTKPID